MPVVFLIGRNGMRYIALPSPLNEDLQPLDKNDLTAWAPIRLGGPNKILGPGIDLRTP